MKSSHIEALEHLVSWMQGEVLPQWIAHARRGPYGWFSRRLSAQGEPMTEEPVYLATQAQMIYVISRAEQLSWVSGMHKVTRNLMDTCGRHGTSACRSDGYVRAVNDSDPPLAIDEHYDLEDHAFFVMANAASFSAYGEDADIRRAYNIVDWLNVQFSCRNGGWRQGNYPTDVRFSRSHRQMLLAFVALLQATQKQIWRQRADDVFRLFAEKFFNSATGEIFQRFDPDWNSLDLGGVVDPKEQLAWVSALSRYRKVTGQPIIAGQPILVERIYRDAIASADTSEEKSCAALVLGIAAGLDLIVTGLNADDCEYIEREVAQRIGRLFRDFVSGISGMFIDDESGASTASMDSLLLLFEAALQASQILHAQANP